MTASLPRVGLSTYVEHASWGAWSTRAAVLPATYVTTVAEAGGVPLLLPPIVPGDVDAAAVVTVAALDALVLTGGPDVDPARYGAAAHAETDAPQATRDAWEVALLRAALAADLPLLAVCRGAQLLNVACGGTLHQHLPDVIGATSHRETLGQFAEVAIEVTPGSRLAAILGDAPRVLCHHHQAIDGLGAGMTVCARAADGTVEAVEVASHPFALGVQWHPEEAGDTRLFVALVEATAAVTAP